MLKPIVLVEDNPKDLELTLVALGKTHLANEVVVLRDGAEALEYLTCAGAHRDRLKGNPAVVLLDLNMPGMSGIDVLRAMRARGDRTPVILLTARGQEKDIEAGFAAGADHYVTKPFSPRALLARVTAALG